MPSTSETAIATPSVNGTLVDRVQQLRLDSQLGRGPGTGAGRGAWLPWVLCGLMAVAWVGVGVRYLKKPTTGDNGAAGQAPAGGAAATPGMPQASGPAAAPGELLLHLKGTVISSLQINLSPNDVSGVVEEIYFKEGDRVKKDALLGKLRSERYQNDYNATKAAKVAAEYRLKELLPESVRPIEIAQAEAEWAEGEAARVRAAQELKRVKGSTVVSPTDIEKAEADLKAAEARVTRLEKAKLLLIEGPRKEKILAAEADLRNAEARLAEAGRLLANCEIKAPIDGTILTKAADKGSVVSPMSFNVAAGLCTLADLSKLEVEIDVPDRQITKVRPGLDCILQADADPARVYRGVLDRVMPIADDTKNVVKIRVKVFLHKGEEPGSFLKPKMSVVGTVYNREFQFDPNKDQPWGDEKK
jgi:HlyD family secretion protein